MYVASRAQLLPDDICRVPSATPSFDDCKRIEINSPPGRYSFWRPKRTQLSQQKCRNLHSPGRLLHLQARLLTESKNERSLRSIMKSSQRCATRLGSGVSSKILSAPNSHINPQRHRLAQNLAEHAQTNSCLRSLGRILSATQCSRILTARLRPLSRVSPIPSNIISPLSNKRF